ncbi:hypothetical protein BJX66DRAFT_328200 [Aspergillus keveii]|uniref:Uncharacterized protein n=1 Tax=Aspergillus keveii TaxID=714993 RepID=A0ABR4FVE8_9EURO
MSDLQAQVDVGQLTVAGLGMFAPLLAAFTADDVAPMAMVQLERLGAAFPISGPQAMQVADCLQRFSSTKLERFGIIIGWRKGDTASFMAKSSSGQSIALLAFCLGEIFPNTFGTILYHLSAKLMPASSAVASPTQLGVAGGILKTKLACLGFGNTLAKHVARIYDAYKHLQVPMPTDLLEPFSAESAVELFHGISRAVRDENCIVRISGTTCLGYIVGAVMILFPDDAMVSVDDYVIHEGPRRSTEKRPERPSQHPVERPRGTVSDLLGSYSLHRMMQPSSRSRRPRGAIPRLAWTSLIYCRCLAQVLYTPRCYEHPTSM